MADDRVDPIDQIPEADLLQQQASLDSQALTDADPVPTIPDTPADADEADRLEQHTAVPGGDDDYPHDADGAEWS